MWFLKIFPLQISSILIIVVLIGLVIVFKKQINDLVTKIFKKITTDSNKIIGSAADGQGIACVCRKILCL